MDTDNLSKETYEGVIEEAEQFDNDLTVQFGLVAEASKDEYEFLEKSDKLIKKLKKMSEEELEDIFSGMAPDSTDLHDTLDQILENIEEIKKIPFSKRHFDY
ncbi:hypothetical protein GCM10011506_33410 [Marivirga lumbricoides]|uniref:Uncharacterized protein n=1 Tax=Marivirga lumbricoides TaxID=1046115 RepID=A0A2T4DH08_9BACT|nr:hypothetical protein C9994_13310 [Marivirga lumbricoides]GGC45128.1 hypothetical protein GCM10011506_33410 [Marivirga lumbricoides]